MKLYLLSQDENNGYDTYDSCVVAADSIKAARQIYPSGNWPARANKYGDIWATSPKNVKVERIGTAKPGTKAGVVLASFNAG